MLAFHLLKNKNKHGYLYMKNNESIKKRNTSFVDNFSRFSARLFQFVFFILLFYLRPSLCYLQDVFGIHRDKALLSLAFFSCNMLPYH